MAPARSQGASDHSVGVVAVALSLVAEARTLEEATRAVAAAEAEA